MSVFLSVTKQPYISVKLKSQCTYFFAINRFRIRVLDGTILTWGDLCVEAF